VDLQLVDDFGEVIAYYLSKPQGEEPVTASIGSEMARHDWKLGSRARGSWNPFELLDLVEDEALRRRNSALWLEYSKTMHGRRVIEWSRGLRDQLLPDEEELTDDQVIADAEAEEWQLDLPRKIYRDLRQNPVLTAWYLDAVAFGEWDEAATYLQGSSPPTVAFT